MCITAGRLAIRGFPTIKLLLPGSNGRQTLEYEGGRTAQDIIEWVTDQLRAEALSRVGLKGTSKGKSHSGGRSAVSPHFPPLPALKAH